MRGIQKGGFTFDNDDERPGDVYFGWMLDQMIDLSLRDIPMGRSASM